MVYRYLQVDCVVAIDYRIWNDIQHIDVSPLISSRNEAMFVIFWQWDLKSAYLGKGLLLAIGLAVCRF